MRDEYGYDDEPIDDANLPAEEFKSVEQLIDESH